MQNPDKDKKGGGDQSTTHIGLLSPGETRVNRVELVPKVKYDSDVSGRYNAHLVPKVKRLRWGSRDCLLGFI